MKIKNRKKNSRAAFWMENNPNCLAFVGKPISLAELSKIIQAGQEGGMGAALKKAQEQRVTVKCSPASS